MNSEAEIHLLKTEYREARMIQTQIKQKTSKGNAPLEYGYALLNLAIIDCATGDDEAIVLENLDLARTIFTELKSPGTIFWCEAVVADLQLRRDQKAEARACYEKWFSRFRTQPDFALVCLSKLGDLEYGMHDRSVTFGYALALMAYAQRSENLVSIYHALRCIGDIFAAEGDDATAVNLFTAALGGFSEMDVHRNKGECLVRIAGVLERRDELTEAASLLRQARILFDRSSQAAQISRIDQRLGNLN
jgi:tetratricopeptide (TPR) repeat protein